MTLFNPGPPNRIWRRNSRRAMLLAVLIAAIVLGFLSNRLAEPLRESWREALRPGLVVLETTSQWAGNFRDHLRSDTAMELAKAQKQAADLGERLRRSELQLQLARSDRGVEPISSTASANPSDLSRLPPLLTSQIIAARVLGRDAQSFLQAREVLDVGRSRGIVSNSLVIDDDVDPSSRPLLDLGRDAAIQPDQLVLAGSRVWGKVIEVGPHTSTVQRTTDSGYRDLVQLAGPREGQLHFAARGVLVGKGEALCKIELVETSQPVTVGDLVFTADDGVLDAPLLYGRVVRLERKPAAPNWEIWMEPAVPRNSPPGHAAVLRMELNPSRIANDR